VNDARVKDCFYTVVEVDSGRASCVCVCFSLFIVSVAKENFLLPGEVAPL